MLRGNGGDVVFAQRQHLRDKRREIVLGQAVQRDLRGGARDLVGGLEVPGIASRERRAPELQLLPRDLVHVPVLVLLDDVD